MKAKTKEIIIIACPIILAILVVGMLAANPFDIRYCDNTINVVMVAPDFTYSAYGGHDRKHSFYQYYDGNKTEALLTVPLEQDPASRLFLQTSTAKALQLCESNTRIVSDLDIHHSIFDYKHSILIFGHQEYVTQEEYNNIKQFVADGGTVIFLDGNSLFAEVQYNIGLSCTDGQRIITGLWEEPFGECEDFSSITLLRGHGYQVVNEAFDNSWAGFYYCGDADKSSLTYEADCPTYKAQTTVIRAWTDKIVSYNIHYGKGQVFHMGIYSENHFDDPTVVKVLNDILHKRS